MPERKILEENPIAIKHGGAILISFREQRGVSLREAAKLSGISTSELSRLEQNKRVLKPSHITRLQAAYRLGTDDIDALVRCDDLAAQSSSSDRPHLKKKQLFKLYFATEMKSKGLEAPHIFIQLPISIETSELSYLVYFTEDNGLGMLPGRSILLADPAARAVLSDVALNCLTFNPLIVKLRRAKNGDLVGIHPGGKPVIFQDAATVKNFHKVVMVFSATYLGLDLSPCR